MTCPSGSLSLLWLPCPLAWPGAPLGTRGGTASKWHHALALPRLLSALLSPSLIWRSCVTAASLVLPAEPRSRCERVTDSLVGCCWALGSSPVPPSARSGSAPVAGARGHMRVPEWRSQAGAHAIRCTRVARPGLQGLVPSSTRRGAAAHPVWGTWRLLVPAGGASLRTDEVWHLPWLPLFHCGLGLSFPRQLAGVRCVPYTRLLC